MYRARNRQSHRQHSARRSARLALASLLVFAGEGLLLPGGAWGQCVQDGTTVTCSGTDTDGFDGSAIDDLLVTVEPAAQVSIAGDDVSAMALGYDSHLNNGIAGEDIATITAGGNGSRGVELGAGSFIFNYGTIEASGEGGTGVEVKAEVGSDNHTGAADSVYNGFVGMITGGSGSGAAVRPFGMEVRRFPAGP